MFFCLPALSRASRLCPRCFLSFGYAFEDSLPVLSPAPGIQPETQGVCSVELSEAVHRLRSLLVSPLSLGNQLSGPTSVEWPVLGWSLLAAQLQRALMVFGTEWPLQGLPPPSFHRQL